MIWKLHYPLLKSIGTDLDTFKSGVLNEKHAVETWNFGNHLSICLQPQEHQEIRCRSGRSQDLPDA